MQVLAHHVYEYKKGIRRMVLHTMRAAERQRAEKKLQENHICYCVQEINDTHINVFFGDEACIEVICSFGGKFLNEYSPEEDFILGILLGYDPARQCQRYMDYKQRMARRTLQHTA